MFHITKEREEKNYRKYFDERGRTLFEYLDENESYATTREAIKDLVIKLDNEDFLKEFKLSINYDNQRQIANKLKEFVFNPHVFLNEFIQAFNYNIQEIYETKNGSAVMSLNGQYYSIENNDLSKFEKLEGIKEFQGMEFDFSDRENVKILLEIMLDDNKSYHKTENMTKHQAIKYVSNLVRDNIYYLHSDEVYEFLKTFDVNDKSYTKREFINFSEEANEYVSSIINKVIPYNGLRMVADLCELSKQQFPENPATTGEFLTSIVDEYQKHHRQIDFLEHAAEKMVSKGLCEAKDFDIKKMRKNAAIYKSKETRYKKALENKTF